MVVDVFIYWSHSLPECNFDLSQNRGLQLILGNIIYIIEYIKFQKKKVLPILNFRP